MSRPAVYLDNNATTLTSPTVAARMLQLLEMGLANPASQHRPGRLALSVLEEARDSVLTCLGCPTQAIATANVIWTSGGTEANNLAISSLCQARPGAAIFGATEHTSVLEAIKLPTIGTNRSITLGVDPSGRYDLEQLERFLVARAPVALVALMAGNNETGVLQDIPLASAICSRHGVPLHCDITQVIGKLPCDLRELGASTVAMTAHKIHGPIGIGALVAQPGINILPMLHGGGQQLGIRPGTEPVWLAAALATALDEMTAARAAGAYARVEHLRDRFETDLSQLPGTHVIAAAAPRLPHTSNIAFAGLDRQALQMALDLEGIACSTGSACASGSSLPSHVLQAMRLPPEWIGGSLRFSFSRDTTDDDVELASRTILRVVRRIR